MDIDAIRRDLDYTIPMVSGLNLQVAEMRDHIHTYDKSILGTIGKLSRLDKTIASIQDDIQQMREDITAAAAMKGMTESAGFGYEDDDGYKRCRSEICMNYYTEMKMYNMHTCYMDCVQEMMKGSRWWKSDMFQCHMNTFLQLALDGTIGRSG